MTPPVLFVILDGWGYAKPSKGNAVALARSPHLTSLWKKYPHTLLHASGVHVGLPKGQHGNSEAGHLNLGAGRVVLQDATRISQSINDGTFFKNPAFLAAARHVKKNHSTLHLVGLLTGHHSGHAIPEHLWSILQFAREQYIPHVVLHLFTDGRDTPLQRAPILLRRLEQVMKPVRGARIGTILGRYYLDRAKRWDRTLVAYHAMVVGARRRAKNARQAIQSAYDRGLTDEFIYPTSIVNTNGKVETVKNHDAVICFNLRSDRARQITKPFVQKNFNQKNHVGERRKKILKDVLYVAMTDFGPDLDSVITAYPSQDIQNTLPMVLGHCKQLYISETEKYAHATYFFNGGYADPVAGEQRIQVKSQKARNFEAHPEMSAAAITRTVMRAWKKNPPDFTCVNFANLDMVGHTGNLVSTIRAVEVVDEQIGELFSLAQKHRAVMVLVGDHGNAEKMIDEPGGEPHSHHTDNPVPLILVPDHRTRITFRKNGCLGHVAPTLLDYLHVPKPAEMLPSLIVHRKK